MAWIIRAVQPYPKAKLVREPTIGMGMTQLTIDGKKVVEGVPTPVNIEENPVLNIQVVGENIGDDGLLWVAILISSIKEEKRPLPLFIKNADISTGGTIVGNIVIDIKSLINFINKYNPGERAFKINGYVGHGNLIEILNFGSGVQLPLCFIRELPDGELRMMYTTSELIEYLNKISNYSIREVSGQMIMLPSELKVLSLLPLDLPSYNIHISIAEAGFNFYKLSMTPGFRDKIITGIDWTMLKEKADDYTGAIK